MELRESNRSAILVLAFVALSASFRFGMNFTSPYSGESKKTIDETNQIQDTSHDAESATHGDTNEKNICFVTSVYGSSAKSADKPPDVVSMAVNHSSYKFLAFTNLKDLDSPGWTKIIKKFDGKYSRAITQSRWGKFMAWRSPSVHKWCRVVFYMDGFCMPKPTNIEEGLYEEIAARIQASESGLAQNLHEIGGGPLAEFDRIVNKKKDNAVNVQASISWLKKQEDFRDGKNVTLYANHYLAYDPHNVKFQEAAKFFWSRYSKEQDSWRDQPLWAYTLHHFKIQPVKLGSFKRLFWDKWKRLGRPHQYA